MKYLIDENISFISNFEVMYFYASWLKFHKKFNKMISSYEEKEDKYNFTAIDVDKFKSLVNQWKIDSIPTLVVLYNGKEVKRLTGMLMTSAFNSILNDTYRKYKTKEGE